MAAVAVLAAVVAAGRSASPPVSFASFEESLSFDGLWTHSWTLDEGQALEIHVSIDDPEELPANGRIKVRWEGPDLPEWAFEGNRGDLYASSTADWQKTLHELDPDVYLVYRAPAAGSYRLTVETVTEGGVEVSEIPRDTGLAQLATPMPASTPIIPDVGVTVSLRPIDALHQDDIVLEAEPNSTPELAIHLPFAASDKDQVLRVFGSTDEAGGWSITTTRLRASRPDDWYRIEHQGTKPKIFTANLQLIEPVVSARIRVYQPGTPGPEDLEPREMPDRKNFGNANPIPYVHPPAQVIPGPVAVFSYYEGRDVNERIHQQDTNFRSFATRKIEPGRGVLLAGGGESAGLRAGGAADRAGTVRRPRSRGRRSDLLPSRRDRCLVDPSAAQHRR